MTDEQLSALLRLKRFEQPPTQYFDRLLEDVHRRQRSDLLRLPLWKIAAERMQTFFSEHSMGHLSYAGALAAVLIVGITAIGLITPGGSEPAERQIAATATIPAPAPVLLANRPSPPADQPIISLQDGKPAPALVPPVLPGASSGLELVKGQTRYVIDARPVSYDPSSL